MEPEVGEGVFTPDSVVSLSLLSPILLDASPAGHRVNPSGGWTSSRDHISRPGRNADIPRGVVEYSVVRERHLGPPGMSVAFVPEAGS